MLTTSAGFALLAMLLSHVHRPRRSSRAAAADAPTGPDAGLLLVIRRLGMRLRLQSDAEIIHVAVDLLQAAGQEGGPGHLIRFRLNGQEQLIRLEDEK